ncbi:MAG TPA: hypothetical protein VFZ59_17835, partial [Verrucomicrobiae bacterium]|nr:hypothetical protein [Verrucomicrobiae bacterium]
LAQVPQGLKRLVGTRSTRVPSFSLIGSLGRGGTRPYQVQVPKRKSGSRNSWLALNLFMPRLMA